MSTISPVSFQGRLAQTKNGNMYEKTNTGKKVGTGVGLVGGLVLASSKVTQLGVLAGLANVFPKLASSNKLFLAFGAAMAGVVTVATLVGRAIGAIPDALINGPRKKKADAAAEAGNPAPAEPAKAEKA